MMYQNISDKKKNVLKNKIILKKTFFWIIVIIVQANLFAVENEFLVDFNNGFKTNLNTHPKFLYDFKIMNNCGVKGGALEVDKDRFGYQENIYDIPERFPLKSGTVDLYFMLRKSVKAKYGFTLMSIGDGNKRNNLIISVVSDSKNRTRIYAYIYTEQGKKLTVTFKWKRLNDFFRWHHVAFSWNKEGVQLFCDGVKVASKKYKLSNINFSPILFLPPKSRSGTNGFSLLIDEVRIRPTQVSSFPNIPDLEMASKATVTQINSNNKELEALAEKRIVDDSKIKINDIPLVPVPKVFKKLNSSFLIPKQISIVIKKNESKKLNNVIRALQKDLSERLGKEFVINLKIADKDNYADAPGVHLSLLSDKLTNKRLTGENKNLARKESYALLIDTNKIQILARNQKGLFYGVQSLVQLIKRSKKGAAIPCGKIVDWPDINFRAVYFRPRAKRYTSIENLKLVVDRLSKYKCNALVLQFEGFMKFSKRPSASSSTSYSPKQIAEFITYAKSRFIEVVPAHQTLGHLDFLYRNSKKYPAVKKLFTNSITLDVTNQDIYPFLFDIFDEILASLPEKPRYFHAGMDEAWGFGKGIAKEKRWKFFAEHINKINAYFKKRGITMIIWSDMLIPKENFYSNVVANGDYTAKAIDSISKDIVICDWNYSANFEMESSEYFRSKGFKVMLSPWMNAQNIYRLTAYAREKSDGIIATTWIDIARQRKKPYEHLYGHLVLRGHVLSMNYAWSKKPEIKRYETVSLYDNPDDYSAFVKGLQPIQKLATRTGQLALGEKEAINLSSYYNSNTSYIDSDEVDNLIGRKKYSGVPYMFSKDKKKNVITVHKPESLNPEIKLSTKAKEIIFMHFLKNKTESYKKSRKAVGFYIIKYTDGSKVKIPLLNGINIRLYAIKDLATGYKQQPENDLVGAFGESIPIVNGKVWASCLGFDKLKKAPVIIQSYAWKNPFPNKNINSIKFSATSDSNIVVLAISIIK